MLWGGGGVSTFVFTVGSMALLAALIIDLLRLLALAEPPIGTRRDRANWNGFTVTMD